MTDERAFFDAVEIGLRGEDPDPQADAVTCQCTLGSDNMDLIPCRSCLDEAARASNFGPPAAETSEQTHPHQCPTCGEHWEHASDACEVIYPHKEWAKCPFCEGRDE